ncbi:hemolysin family protein [uncultured Dialister sp.]|jgi:putative hemolysin|uniref:hemolysin family protein n=1 Tax=uncultured Dialister sp. TaxID=278064 RepID=UPI00260D1BD8|nr:hemolysin family protein [uncultured Dialister sp.]
MDDGHIWLELCIIVLLVLGNGVCSLAEIAIVGARKTKLQEMIDEGNKNAAYALMLAERKEELFSTIQVGITTISIITGMFSGASLSGPLGRELAKIPFLAPYAQAVSVVVVMVLVTYFSLIIGELAPKWIAIAIPEKAACFVARPMIIMATICKPLVLFSTWSTKMVVGLLGIKMGGEQPVSEEEIKVLLQQGARLGTFDKEEPEIIDNVFELNDRTAADCMTARPQLTWIDLEDSEKKIWSDMMDSSHFRLPVGKGSLDDFKGLADLSEVLMDQHLHPGKPLKQSLMENVHAPVYIPETLTLTKVLKLFKSRGVHEAIVIDEYGTLSGLITLHDVLEEIVGDMPGDREDMLEEQNKFIRRSENSWLVEGLCSIDDFREYFHMEEELPGEAEGYYKTLGGFITYLLGYIPKETEKAVYGPFTFEVMDCDNHRVDKVLVTKRKQKKGEE